MTDIPVSVWSGTFRLFGVDVKCHKLSDGTNIIEEESMNAVVTAMLSGSLDFTDLKAFNEFQSGRLPDNGNGDA
jgi:hypothetical protein